MIYPAIVLMVVHSGPDERSMLWLSPFFGMCLPMGWVVWRGRWIDAGRVVSVFVWALLASAVAYGLLRATLANFDRFLGRVPELPERFIPMPAPEPSKSRSAELYSDWA